MSFRILFWAILFFAVFPTNATFSAARAGENSQIKSGFDLLYQLKFEEARREFTNWQKENPKDPLGYVALAASYLFEEFLAQRVLTSEFFLDDNRLLGGIRGKPDEGRKSNFLSANRTGRELALKLLDADPRDTEALFAMTIATGTRADFTAILEGRQLESLALIKEAEGYAKQLLVLQPDQADGWLSLGVANYILGSLPAYKRFFLWFRQIHGDKVIGMEQLRLTAEKGYYLKPFAQIFLALAAMREGRENVARSLLRDLVAQFPSNPLFQEELVRLNKNCAVSIDGGQ
jgi:tetratricopeptide (TPR) repeat protein